MTAANMQQRRPKRGDIWKWTTLYGTAHMHTLIECTADYGTISSWITFYFDAQQSARTPCISIVVFIVNPDGTLQLKNSGGTWEKIA